LSKDVKYLVETEKMWKPKDLQERIKSSCQDPNLPSGAMKDACAYLLEDYHKAIATEVATRWTEDAEEFEDDIVPLEFCEKVGACKSGQKGLNQMMSEGDIKNKLLEEEKKEKEAKANRSAEPKKPKKPKKKKVEEEEEDEEE